MAYVDIDNFKAYNDAYGFSRGDAVIVLTARILKEQTAGSGNSDDFVGHIGGDDFIVVSTPDKIEQLCCGIIDVFDEKILEFYNDEDRFNCCIRAMNRRGDSDVFPLMSVSIAIVSNQYRELKSHVDIGDIASELKKKLKVMPGSNYLADRRTDSPGEPRNQECGEGRVAARQFQAKPKLNDDQLKGGKFKDA